MPKKRYRTKNNELTDRAYFEAVRVLRNCSHPAGIKASARSDGYSQVWARDSMITLLGAILLRDTAIDQTLKSSFDTLRKAQTPLGCIPNNVDTRTLKANYQAYADGGLWFVLGAAAFFEGKGDITFLRKQYPVIKKILNWYSYQDVDNSGLLSMQEAADWEDMFAVRGKGLYMNVLYYLALTKASRIAGLLCDVRGQKLYRRTATELRSKINRHFWFTKNQDPLVIIRDAFGGDDARKSFRFLANKRFSAHQKTMHKKDRYYLPYITFRDFGKWFDSFGNLLAIIAGVADKKRTKAILAFIDKYGLASPYPIKAIYPPVFPNQKDWRYYYRAHNLNLPHQYHNGAIWPFLGGFYVAALVKAGEFRKAREAFVSLAALNRKGMESIWEFNEWCHGKTFKPMGMAEQAWSAGMYIYAYHAVHKKKLPFF